MNATRRLRESDGLVIAVALATLLALALRAWDISGQVVLDDEWHAIHKLIGSSYWNIFRSFGVADHSIPLTLLYKAMADTIGLAEGRLRVLQIVCGTALVPAGAWLAWRATRDAPAAALLAFVLAGAPFLVLWSRFARPYAVMVLLTTLCIGALWHWRTHRTRRAGAWVAATAALSAWFHPLSAMYAAIGWLFIFAEDVTAPAQCLPRPSRASIKLAVDMGLAALVLLGPPVIHDLHSLREKAGGERPGPETYERVISLFWGGLPTPVLAACTLLAAWGAIVILRRDRRLGLYLLVVALGPPVAVTVMGSIWVSEGQNFARYVLPTQVFTLFFGAVGAASLVRALIPARDQAAAWIASGVLAAAYLVATPTIGYVATLGPWFGHLSYHWDYRYRWLAGERGEHRYDPPEFYRRLGRMAPGTATVIEAPFIWEAPYDPYEYYATFYRQRELFGMLHDLCRDGPRLGEPPERDRRFRFRLFVFLDDRDAVRNSGARYLVVHRTFPRSRPFPEADRCVAKLTQLYGAPIEDDARLVVFDLRPRESASPTVAR
jgi:hypothetical protein